MEDCVFCKIINKELPGKIVYEDDVVIALVPIDIVNKGHTLLIPKKHFKNILDVDSDVFKHFGEVLRILSIKLMKDNDAEGVNILNANNEVAGQSVMHLHFHIIPTSGKKCI
ncbi:MAG: HIT domain-containing protein [bacterium]